MQRPYRMITFHCFILTTKVYDSIIVLPVSFSPIVLLSDQSEATPT